MVNCLRDLLILLAFFFLNKDETQPRRPFKWLTLGNCEHHRSELATALRGFGLAYVTLTFVTFVMPRSRLPYRSHSFRLAFVQSRGPRKEQARAASLACMKAEGMTRPKALPLGASQQKIAHQGFTNR